MSRIREKRTQAGTNKKSVKQTFVPPEILQFETALEKERAALKDGSWLEDAMKPATDEELSHPDLPTINWYEQDLEKGTPRRLISTTATIEDRKRDRDMFQMIEESEDNPDYDDAELNRRLIDSLIENPNFADLTQELKEIKAGIMTKEEQKAEELRMSKQYEKQNAQMAANLMQDTRQIFQNLANDPDAAAAKAELQEVVDNMPDIDNIDNPEFQAILQKAMSKLNDDPTFQKKMASMPDVDPNEVDMQFAEYERKLEEAQKKVNKQLPRRTVDDPVDEAGTRKLMYEMRDVLKSMGGDPTMEAELDAALANDLANRRLGDTERDGDGEGLATDMLNLARSLKPFKSKIPAEEDNAPAELQAKVDKIMQDPKLMEKLLYIQNLIKEAERAKSDITSIPHNVAPDPYKLDDDYTTTLQERIEIARQDPEHAAALDRLRVNVPRPFNVSPSLKAFNQAMQFAYIGANDDIRRVLWRSYQKARRLPTFLLNIGNEAWDILYYSQAVTWGSNQNREDHLRMLLADLKRVGRDGPPTHPSSLVKEGDGQYLET